MSQSTYGGAWLLGAVPAPDVFTPEDRSDEHRMIATTAHAFMDQDVVPRRDALESKDWALARQLMRQCGDLGLLGVDVPEALGGVGLDVVSSVIVSEAMGRYASFATTAGAHMGLCVVPLLWFGTEAQRRRYLPRLASGEIVGAYALSEAASGSDALGARATATRLPDGGFALNGEKLWITNCGFADLYVVFAKVDGEQFTAFLVERGTPGVTPGREEHKMGLHGSSTAPLLLQDARVGADAVLGEIGKGHKVAFTVLNYGRFKLGAMTTGGSRQALKDAAVYASHRKQFGQPIATFGAIQSKLAEMAARLYATESALYRVAGSLEADGGDHEARSGTFERHAIEASILKVLASETLQFVLDENVQIHGGNGFVRDYPAEGYYRDARVNRIFEGTNEINRLLLAGQLARRAMKNDVGLIAAARRLPDELLALPLTPPDEPDALVAHLASGLRKTTVLLLGAAMQRFAEKLADEQEVLMWVADLAIEAFAVDSACARAARAAGRSGPETAAHRDAALLAALEASFRADAILRRALPAVLEGDMLRIALAGARRLLKTPPIDQRPLRRALAAACLARPAAVFG
ncbi:MAG TPA: acyl-CoA dehydrogenase family protein [Luteitalea sp.]|nr:acyl-CoA dehydrogenase family protein [Luteitalea sp.]